MFVIKLEKQEKISTENKFHDIWSEDKQIMALWTLCNFRLKLEHFQHKTKFGQFYKNFKLP